MTQAAPTATRAPAVAVDGVWKLFPAGDGVVHALIDIGFTVEAGEFLALMGTSGSGKSTLLHLLGGLDRPTKGEIHLSGRPTNGLTEGQFSALRHSSIGFIFQSYNLIPFLTAVENVELPLMFEPVERATVRRRATELLELVGLGHRMEHRPSRMSGGEQQRTAIARALIGAPQVVLADEPTANLDHRTGESVITLLSDLCRRLGVTVIAATHDAAVAAHATRVLRMSDGRIVAQSSTDPG
jgi:putative ABC transport system ATP-binding protein